MSSLCASKSKIILTQKNWQSWYFRDLLRLPAFHPPIRSFSKPPQNSGKVITPVDQLLFSWQMSQIFAAAADSCHLRGCPGCQEGWRSSEPQPVCATLQTWWHWSVNTVDSTNQVLSNQGNSKSPPCEECSPKLLKMAKRFWSVDAEHVARGLSLFLAVAGNKSINFS